MPSLQMLPVALRRLLARRPWIHWLVVLASRGRDRRRRATRVDRIDDARRAWGEHAEGARRRAATRDRANRST